jgi:hypothetical protein
MSDLNDGTGLTNNTNLTSDGDGGGLDGQQTLLGSGGAWVQVPGQLRLNLPGVDPANDPTRPQLGLVDQVPGTATNPIYRYRDGPVVLYRVPADGDQTAAARLLVERGYVR